MKTPEQIAREAYGQDPGKGWAVGSAEIVPMIVKAIEADRAQRVPTIYANRGDWEVSHFTDATGVWVNLQIHSPNADPDDTSDSTALSLLLSDVEAAELTRELTPAKKVHIVFDGPPDAEPGRFVEVETPDGQGISLGKWIERADGYWALEIEVAQPPQNNPRAHIGADEIATVAVRQMGYSDYPRTTSSETLLAYDTARLAVQITRGEERTRP